MDVGKNFSKINQKIKYICFDTYCVNLIQFYYLKYNNLNVGFSKNYNFYLNSNLKEIQFLKKNNSNSLFIANCQYQKHQSNLERNSRSS